MSFIITGVQATQGSVSVEPDGTLTYSIPADFVGDTITCSIEGRIVIRSKPADQAPITAPDVATVMAGGSVSIDVLGNDVDPEGDVLTVTQATADPGSVTVAADNTLFYTAPADFIGTAGIAYVVSDPVGNAREGQVSVDVTPYAAPSLPPVVANEAVVMVAGGTVQIDVLVNDVDPEGGALTVIHATADRGSVVVTPEGWLAYTALEGVSGTATLSYTVADPAGLTSDASVAVEIVLLSISEGDTEGEFVVSAAPGTLTVTIVEPAEYAGDYVVETADLASGPVSLVPPKIAGTTEVGATLMAMPGLWTFDEGDAPLEVARQWMRDGAAIDGATGATYVVDAADAGATLGVVETAKTASGTREAASAAVAGPDVVAEPAPEPGTAWTPTALPGLALWLDASNAATLTLSGEEVVEIADKSGNGRHLRKVAALPAPRLEATLGGKPALRFPRTAVLRSSAASLPGLPGMPGLTVIAVTQAHQPTGFNKCFAVRNVQAASGQQMNLQTGYSMMWFGNGNRYWDMNASSPVVCVARYPENGTHGATEWWRNGAKLAATSTARGTNSVSLPADAYIQIGSEDSTTSEQAEVLVVVGPLSAADRQRAEGYLAHKWGLAGQLPNAHPHKSSPPT